MQQFLRKLETSPMTRIVGLGSSNTERGIHAEGCHNWLDWLDVGLSERFGRVHHTINAGVSGETTREMLARFDRDVAHYQPHLVLITAGGNDCNPVNALPPAEFRANLTQLVNRVHALDGCEAVLQTYYSFDAEAMPEEAERARRLPEYMELVREVAVEECAFLVDHLVRWEPLRRADLTLYRTLMRDPMHLNPLGNMVFGLDLLRSFGIFPQGEMVLRCARGLEVQRIMDGSG